MRSEPFAAYLPSLKNTRIEPWIASNGYWACYVFGHAVTRNGNIRKFKSKGAAVAAGEAYLRYAMELTNA